jgi:hypothetical protein
MVANGQPTGDTNIFALLSQTNSIATNLPANDTNEVRPFIVEMHDMPISRAIEALARNAGVNYLVDSRLCDWWLLPNSDGYSTHEPTVTFCSTNLPAKQALTRILQEHHLALIEDPVTTIARITFTNQVINPADASLVGSVTNKAIPIQFEDVPITTCLESLARLAGINYLLDPKIGYGMPDNNGQIKPEPVLSVRWENITPIQAFVAICENYDLDIVNDAATGAIHIKPKD